MTTPRYLRYTLSMAPAGERRRRPPSPFDDWSGAAAHARVPDPEALEYAHPEAVVLVESLQPQGWQVEDDGHSLVFWLEEGTLPDSAGAALAALARLGRLDVRPESPGWDQAWKEFHVPHVVGQVYLRPPWFPARDDLLDVVVDAAQAFGTGGHPTTRQCVAELQRITPGSLLDLGCGSGVVSLAALRLGFVPVLGVDIDPQSVKEARENAGRNGLTADFLQADATDPRLPLPAADTIVANIALRPILRLAGRFRRDDVEPDRLLRPSHLLLAGLLLEQGEEAAAAFPQLRIAGSLEEDVWLLLHLVPA